MRKAHKNLNKYSLKMYSSLVRGLAVVAAGLLAAGGDPLPMFLLLTCGFVVAALLAVVP